MHQAVGEMATIIHFSCCIIRAVFSDRDHTIHISTIHTDNITIIYISWYMIRADGCSNINNHNVRKVISISCYIISWFNIKYKHVSFMILENTANHRATATQWLLSTKKGTQGSWIANQYWAASFTSRFGFHQKVIKWGRRSKSCRWASCCISSTE